MQARGAFCKGREERGEGCCKTEGRGGATNGRRPAINLIVQWGLDGTQTAAIEGVQWGPSRGRVGNNPSSVAAALPHQAAAC